MIDSLIVQVMCAVNNMLYATECYLKLVNSFFLLLRLSGPQKKQWKTISGCLIHFWNTLPTLLWSGNQLKNCNYDVLVHNIPTHFVCQAT